MTGRKMMKSGPRWGQPDRVAGRVPAVEQEVEDQDERDRSKDLLQTGALASTEHVGPALADEVGALQDRCGAVVLLVGHGGAPIRLEGAPDGLGCLRATVHRMASPVNRSFGTVRGTGGLRTGDPSNRAPGHDRRALPTPGATFARSLLAPPDPLLGCRFADGQDEETTDQRRRIGASWAPCSGSSVEPRDSARWRPQPERAAPPPAARRSTPTSGAASRRRCRSSSIWWSST